MIRAVQRVIGLMAIAVLAAASLVAVAVAPAGADTIGYTIQQTETKDFNSGYGCRLANINVTTGVVTGIGNYLDSAAYSCASDLAFSPTGGLYGIAQSIVFSGEASNGDAAPAAVVNLVHLVQFNTTSGAFTDLGPIGSLPSHLFTWSGGITFDAAGNLYVAIRGENVNCDETCVYKVDPANTTGATLVGATGENYVGGLASNCAGQSITLLPGQAAALADVKVPAVGKQFATINLTTGLPTPVGPTFAGGQYLQSVEYDAAGAVWAIGTALPQGFGQAPGKVYTINPATGVTTAGATLSNLDANTLITGLAIAPLSCTVPPPPTPPVVIPAFTG